MFYTIASRLSIIGGDKTIKNFFKVFIVGSMLYVYTHYYLFSAERMLFLEKIKQYIYYVLILDLLITYFLMKWNTSTDEYDEKEYTKSTESSLQINADLQELKRMAQLEANKTQMLQNQQYETYNSNNKDDTISKQSPFMTRDEIKSNELKEKEKKQKSESSKDVLNKDKINNSVKKSKKTDTNSHKSTSSVSLPVAQEKIIINTTKDKIKEKKNITKNIDTDTDINLPIFMGK
jgi:hypothetical protein